MWVVVIYKFTKNWARYWCVGAWPRGDRQHWRSMHRGWAQWWPSLRGAVSGDPGPDPEAEAWGIRSRSEEASQAWDRAPGTEDSSSAPSAGSRPWIVPWYRLLDVLHHLVPVGTTAPGSLRQPPWAPKTTSWSLLRREPPPSFSCTKRQIFVVPLVWFYEIWGVNAYVVHITIYYVNFDEFKIGNWEWIGPTGCEVTMTMKLRHVKWRISKIRLIYHSSFMGAANRDIICATKVERGRGNGRFREVLITRIEVKKTKKKKLNHELCGWREPLLSFCHTDNSKQCRYSPFHDALNLIR